MPTGKPANIMAALFEHAALLETTGPALHVVFPEETEAYTPPTDANGDIVPFLEVNFFPNAPAWQGLTEGRMDQGLLQIGVVWPARRGLIKPAEVVAQVMDHFAKGLALYSGGTKVTISAEPWASAALPEADRSTTPITIPWQA